MTEYQSVRILYMEDDPGLARILKKNLERKGYQVEIAPNGEDGMARMAEDCFDIVLVDHNMPGMSGLEVIGALQEQHNPTPTVMVTGGGNERLAVDAIKLGAADYLVKDADLAYLELLPIVIERILERERMRQECERMMGALNENEERYRNLFERSPNGIVVSVNGKLEFVNPAGTFLLGLSTPTQGEGRPLEEFFDPGNRPELECYLEQLSQCSWLPQRLLQPDGKRLKVELRGMPFNYQGEPAVLTILREFSYQEQD